MSPITGAVHRSGVSTCTADAGPSDFLEFIDVALELADVYGALLDRVRTLAALYGVDVVGLTARLDQVDAATAELTARLNALTSAQRRACIR